MHDLIMIHVIDTMVRLAGPEGLRSVVAESAMVPSTADPQSRAQAWAQPARLGSHRRRLAPPLPEPGTHPRFRHRAKPSTWLPLHNLLRKRKYRLLFSSQCGRRAGPKGPNKELIDAVVARKRRNPSGAVLALPSRSPWLSVWRSIRMWCAASGALPTGRSRTQQVHPG